MPNSQFILLIFWEGGWALFILSDTLLEARDSRTMNLIFFYVSDLLLVL